MADGRCPETPLRRDLWQALGLEPSDPQAPQSIKARVVEPAFGPAGFAALAPVVHRQAVAGDPGAIAILERSASALAEMVEAVAAGLQLVEPPVVALGGALRHLPLFRRTLEQALAGAGRQALLQEPRGDGASGALSLAQELLALNRH